MLFSVTHSIWPRGCTQFRQHNVMAGRGWVASPGQLLYNQGVTSSSMGPSSLCCGVTCTCTSP